MTTKFSSSDQSLTIQEQLRRRRKAISATELAELLDVSDRYLYDHAKKGTIPSIHLPGSMLRFDPTRIAAWLDQCSA